MTWPSRDPLAQISEEAWDILGLSAHPKGFHATGPYAISAQALRRRGLVRFAPVFTKGERDGYQVYITVRGQKVLLDHIKAERLKKMTVDITDAKED